MVLFAVMQDRCGYLIPWKTLGGAATFLFGFPVAILGTNNLNTMDFTLSRIFFIFGCLLLAVQAILFAARRCGWMSYLLAFGLCGSLGVVGLVLVNYVNQKRDATLTKDTPSVQIPNTAPTPTPSPMPAQPLKEATVVPEETNSEAAPVAPKPRRKPSKATELQRLREKALRDLDYKNPKQ